MKNYHCSSNYKLLLITLDFPQQSGGISRHLSSIVHHIPPEKVHVIGVPAPGFRVFDEDRNYEVTRISLPLGWNRYRAQIKYLAPFFLRTMRSEQDATHVFCGQVHQSLLIPAYFFSRWYGAKFGVFAYGLDLLHPQTRFYGPLVNRLLRAADLLVADSGAAAHIASEIGVAKDSISVIHPPIAPVIDNSNVSSASIRYRHNLTSKKIILTVGRLVERKGHDMLIRALPEIVRSVPEVHYLVVGTGPMEESLKSLAAELGIANHVTFAGFVQEEELSAYYKASDIFVMLSRELSSGDVEGFGIVYLEANLHAKPVIGGNSGGVPEAVEHGVSGLLVDPESIEEIAYTCARLLSDAKLRQKLGENGRDRVLSDFTSQRAAEKLIAILDTD